MEPLSCRDIARASGLSPANVAKLSKKKSWAGVPIDTVEAFARGCGVDLLNQRKALGYLRKVAGKSLKMAHLKRGDATQRRLFAELMSG